MSSEHIPLTQQLRQSAASGSPPARPAATRAGARCRRSCASTAAVVDPVQRGRDRGAPAAHELAEQLVRDPQPHADPVRGHAAPALGEVPEEHQQPRLDRRELQKGLMDRHPLGAPDARSSSAPSPAATARACARRLVEDGQPRAARARARARGSGRARRRAGGSTAGSRRPRRAARCTCVPASIRSRASSPSSMRKPSRPGRPRRAAPPSARAEASSRGQRARRARSAISSGRNPQPELRVELQDPRPTAADRARPPLSLPAASLPTGELKHNVEIQRPHFARATAVVGSPGRQLGGKMCLAIPGQIVEVVDPANRSRRSTWPASSAPSTSACSTPTATGSARATGC